MDQIWPGLGCGVPVAMRIYLPSCGSHLLLDGGRPLGRGLCGRTFAEPLLTSPALHGTVMVGEVGVAVGRGGGGREGGERGGGGVGTIDSEARGEKPGGGCI